MNWEAIARIGYEAYLRERKVADLTGGWDSLPETVKAGWIVAAKEITRAAILAEPR